MITERDPQLTLIAIDPLWSQITGGRSEAPLW